MAEEDYQRDDTSERVARKAAQTNEIQNMMWR